MLKEKELVKNIIILSFGTIIPKIFNLITLPLITGILTKAEYGIYDLILTLTTFILPVGTLQIQAAVFRFLINEKSKKKKIKIVTNALFFITISSIVVLFIVFICMKKLIFSLKILVIVYYFLDIYLNILKQIVRGNSENKIYSKSIIIYSVVQLLFFLILVFVFKYGLVGLILSLIVGEVFSIVYIILRMNIFNYFKIKYINKLEIKELLEYSWPLIPNSISSWIVSLSDRIIITFFLGIEKTAIYAVANKLPNLFTMIQFIFNLAWQENASLNIKSEDSTEYYKKIFERYLEFLTGMMSLLIVLTPYIFKTLIKGNYLEAYNHILLLYLATVFSSLSSYLGGIYIAHKKTKEIGLTTIITALINILFNLLFINNLKIYAASLSTLISYLFLFCYRIFDIQKIQKIKFSYRDIIKNIFFLIIILLLCSIKNYKINIFNFILGIIGFIYFNRLLLKELYLKIIRK